MASNYRSGTVGESEPLFYSTDRAISSLYVQCEVWKQGEATAEQIIDLTEIAARPGSYEGSVTINTEGTYNYFYIPYTDSGHTSESEMAPRASEVMVIRLTADKYGGVRPSPGIGITENDIKAVIKGVAKEL